MIVRPIFRAAHRIARKPFVLSHISFVVEGKFAPSIAEAHFFQQIDEARIGAQWVPVRKDLQWDNAPATFLVCFFKKVQCGVVIAECEINQRRVTRRNIRLKVIELLEGFARLLSISRPRVLGCEGGYGEGKTGSNSDALFIRFQRLDRDFRSARNSSRDNSCRRARSWDRSPPPCGIAPKPLDSLLEPRATYP